LGAGLVATGIRTGTAEAGVEGHVAEEAPMKTAERTTADVPAADERRAKRGSAAGGLRSAHRLAFLQPLHQLKALYLADS